MPFLPISYSLQGRLLRILYFTVSKYELHSIVTCYLLRITLAVMDCPLYQRKANHNDINN